MSDIRGRLDLLDHRLDAIDADLVTKPCRHLIFLGDYVDRGPHPARVVHRLIEITEIYRAVPQVPLHS